MYLITTFRVIEEVSYRISANIPHIGIFLLLNIGIGIGPKNSISVRPQFWLLLDKKQFEQLDDELFKWAFLLISDISQTKQSVHQLKK